MQALLWVAVACSSGDDVPSSVGRDPGAEEDPGSQDTVEDGIPSDWVPGASDVLPRVPDTAPYLGPVVHPDEASIQLAPAADLATEDGWFQHQLHVQDATHLWRYRRAEGDDCTVVTVDVGGVSGRLGLDDLPSESVATLRADPDRSLLVDVTGDGLLDVVATPGWDAGDSGLLIYQGGLPEAGLTPVYARLIDFEDRTWVAAAPGDLDGDGSDDLLVAGTTEDWWGSDVRAFPLPLERGELAVESALAELTTAYSFEPALGDGDLDGDGADDIAGLVTERASDSHVPASVLVAFTDVGHSADPLPAASLQPEDAGAWPPYWQLRVPRLADMNGDGYSDVVVPAPFYYAGPHENGRVFVLEAPLPSDGAIEDAATSVIFEPRKRGYEPFGDRYVQPGDFDGDGTFDLAINGNDLSQPDSSHNGDLHVFLAPSGTVSSLAADLIISDGVPEPVLMFAQEGELDVDQDGRTDILGCCTTAGDWFVFTGAQLF